MVRPLMHFLYNHNNPVRSTLLTFWLCTCHDAFWQVAWAHTRWCLRDSWFSPEFLKVEMGQQITTLRINPKMLAGRVTVWRHRAADERVVRFSQGSRQAAGDRLVRSKQGSRQATSKSTVSSKQRSRQAARKTVEVLAEF